MENILKKAVDNINLDEVEEILNKISNTELENYKIKAYNNPKNDKKINIMEYIFNCLSYYEKMSKNEDNILLKNICSSYFTEECSTFITSKYKKKINDALKIIEIIIKKAPILLTETIYNSAVYHQCHPLINIYKNYYIGKKEEEYCFICNCENNLYLLDSVCDCKKSHIHLYCLIDMVKKKYYNCTVYLKEYKPSIYKRSIFFPFLNIYPEPLSPTSYIFIDQSDFDMSMHYAAVYFEFYRIEELLNNVNDETFLNFKNKCMKYPSNIDTRRIINKFSMFKSNEQKKYLIMNERSFARIEHQQYFDIYNKINQLLKNKCLEIDLKIN